MESIHGHPEGSSSSWLLLWACRFFIRAMFSSSLILCTLEQETQIAKRAINMQYFCWQWTDKINISTRCSCNTCVTMMIIVTVDPTNGILLRRARISCLASLLLLFFVCLFDCVFVFTAGMQQLPASTTRPPVFSYGTCVLVTDPWLPKLLFVKAVR